MEQQDFERLQSLYDERLLEIKREGVFVELNYRQQILPAYLECSKNDYLKFKSIIESKISLELCDKKGIPLLKIPRQQYFTKRDGPQDKYRVYLENKQVMRENFSEGKQYILVKNNATIGVLSKILERRLKGGRYFEKIENFIGNDSCVKIDIDENLKLGEFNYQEDLNKEQNEAIEKAFNNHLTFVKGPPGCGKSKTVSRMVKMMAERGLKVLVGSISNIANETLINEIVQEVKEHNRLRELAPNNRYIRKLNVLINYSRKALEKMSEQANSFSINNQLYREIVKVNNTDYYNEENIMEEIEKLQRGENVSKVFFSIYMQCYNSIVKDVNIIISTTINSFKLYEHSPFKPDVGIMDEAAQASWTDTYGFLTFGVKRMVFVGDEKQLRPTVIGDATANQILKETMFEKLSLKNEDYFTHLVEQYRMHPSISEFPNLFIYEGKLRDAEITLKERESSIEYFKKYRMSFVAHEFQESVVQSTKTLDNKKPVNEYSNIHEGSLLMDLLFMIPRNEWKNVGVLTFYDMQCQALIENLKEQVPNFESTGLSVRTIDGYQGGEKDYILVSTVRSNPENNPGFCIELNRVNVALTRAKRGLIVFGNPGTLTQGKPFGNKDENIWGKFYQHMLKTNQVLTSDQFHIILDQKDVEIKPMIHEEPKKEEKMQENIEPLIDREEENSLPTFYQELTLIFESFQSLKIEESDEELLENNPKYRKEAKTIIGDMKKINKVNLDGQKNELKEKIQNYLSLEAVEKGNIQKNKVGGKEQKKDESFQLKFITLAKESLTKKECEYALNVINFLSSNIYEIMDKNSRDINITVLNSLSSYLIEEKQKLVDSLWIEFEEDINAEVLKNLSALKETEKLKTLVSLKLKFKVLIECSREIEKLITLNEAPVNYKI